MSVLSGVRRKLVEIYRAFLTFDVQLIYHMVVNRLKYRHYEDFLVADRPAKFSFLLRHYGYLLEKYRENPVSNQKNNGPIWVFWWQGEEKMPDIIRFCYSSLKKNAPEDCPVILLHRNNYMEYVDIPQYIIQRLEDKIIGLTHFSDVVRIALLASRGGVWVDASVYVSEKMSDSIFKHAYFSAREASHTYAVCRGQYTFFLLGAAPNSPWLMFARDVWFEYWKKSSKLLDYAQSDYILTMALDQVPEMKSDVLKGVIDTPHINTLQDKRNEPCDEDTYRKMMSECSFYKLSYKLSYQEKDADGNLTYYGWMRHFERLDAESANIVES